MGRTILDRLLAKFMPSETLTGRLSSRLLPMLFVAYACLLPRELTIEVMGASLFPYRLALIIMAPFAITNIARSPIRPSVLDWVLVFAAIWYPYSLYMSTSLDAGLVSGGSYGLDLSLAYLMGRSAIRTPQDFRTLFFYFIPGLLAVVAILALESVSHKMILRPRLADFLGLPEPYIYYRIRYGLLRAMGPFPHPILGGVFLTGMLPLGWYLTHNLKQRVIGCVAALGAIFTVSSTAVIGMMIGAILIAFDITQRLTRLPVFVFAGFYLTILISTIALMSESGVVSFFIRRLTIDPGSGYYRMWIWEYGGAEAWDNPLYGIGQRDWARPIGMLSDSVDAYWLFLAMFHGFPALIAALCLMVGTIIAVLRTQKYRHPADRDVAKGIMFFIGIMIFSGLTVHLWESIHAWVWAIVGGGISLATQARQVPEPTHVEPSVSKFSWLLGSSSRSRPRPQGHQAGFFRSAGPGT